MSQTLPPEHKYGYILNEHDEVGKYSEILRIGKIFENKRKNIDKLMKEEELEHRRLKDRGMFPSFHDHTEYWTSKDTFGYFK